MQKNTTEFKHAPFKSFTIADGEPRLSEIINVLVGDRFLVNMPKPSGRIVEPCLGTPQDLAEHEGTSDDGRTVEFEFTAMKTGIAPLEFPLIEDDWDGANDPDPKKAEQYLSVWWRVECSSLSGR